MDLEQVLGSATGYPYSKDSFILVTVEFGWLADPECIANLRQRGSVRQCRHGHDRLARRHGHVCRDFRHGHGVKANVCFWKRQRDLF